MHTHHSSLAQAGEEVLTEDVQEVISYQPHWIVRKGNLIFLAVVLLLLLLSWLIRYPDIISSSARLISSNPPRLIAARSEGRLTKLLVTNDQKIEKGQHLGYMESTGQYEQVMRLSGWITSTINSNTLDIEKIISQPPPFLTGLGEIQSSYQEFQNQWEIARQTLKDGYFGEKRAALQQDLQYLATLKQNVTHQKSLQEKDRSLQEKEYLAYQKLAEQKVIAPLELSHYESKLLSKDQNIDHLDAQITNRNFSSHEKRKELLDLEKMVSDHQQQFRSSLLDLKSDVEKWLQLYVFTASETGNVNFASSLSENELVTIGQPLFYILPEQTSYYVEIMAGQKGVGKVTPGQKVILRVEGYPSNEFGHLTAYVNYIASIPSRTDSFLVKAVLPDGLRTNQHSVLLFRNNLSAKAEVILDDRRLLERMTGQLKKMLERN